MMQIEGYNNALTSHLTQDTRAVNEYVNHKLCIEIEVVWRLKIDHNHDWG